MVACGALEVVKGRGLCPSCGARRAHETAAHLVAAVEPRWHHQRLAMAEPTAPQPGFLLLCVAPRYDRGMRKWLKAPEELTKRFVALIPKHPDAQPKQMFGYQACFVRGNFWMGLHEANVVVRLPDGLDARFPEVAGAGAFDPMGGRPMKGWFVVPPEVVRSDERLGRFMRASFEAVRELPAKVAKPRKAASTKPAKAATRARAKSARR